MGFHTMTGTVDGDLESYSKFGAGYPVIVQWCRIRRNSQDAAKCGFFGVRHYGLRRCCYLQGGYKIFRAACVTVPVKRRDSS